MDLNTFIDLLPKAEMHLHIEGTVRWAVARGYFTDSLPDGDPPWLHPDYRFRDFDHFALVMRPSVSYIRASAENYGLAAASYFEDLVAQNVRYVELSVGMGLAILNDESTLANIISTVQAVVPSGLHLRLIAGINRRYPPTPDSLEYHLILNTSGIDGLDLHSDERSNGPCVFSDIYQAARERGYLLRAHAGELTGPQTIRETLACLGVSRIEHGVTAAQDESLVEELSCMSGITLDMCPTSNVKLGVVESLAAHPIGAFLRQGVKVTCSTDDPAIFGVSLTDELRNLVTHQQFTARELAQLQINAFEVALLPEDVRSGLIAEVEALCQRFEMEAA